MTLALRADLLDLRYRAARSNYTLIPFDNLPAPHQSLLRSFREDTEFFGVLSPVCSDGLGIQAVTHATAALFRGLENPSPLATEARSAGVRGIARLILDGVLEVEWEGRFLSGPTAHEVVFPDAASRGEAEMDRFSAAALQYGESFAEASAFSLSERLYTFNTLPATPDWRRTLPHTAAVTAFLRLDRGGESFRRLAAAGFESSLATGAWSSWSGAGAFDGPTVKLYVSPLPQWLPDAVHAVAEVSGESGGVVSLKVGNDIYGILRPDKLVLYFTTHKHLLAVARRLEEHLRGVPAQGVPFTAQLGDDGLLSWGADPHASPSDLHWLGQESWRSSIARRLASSLVAARGSPGEIVPPRRFAVDRLALEGVDPGSWCPTEEFAGFVPRELTAFDAAH